MKHIVLMAMIAGSLSLVAGPASAQYRSQHRPQYRAAPLKPVTTMTHRPTVRSSRIAPNVRPGIASNIRSNVRGGRLIANDGAGIVAGGAGNFRGNGIVAGGAGNFRGNGIVAGGAGNFRAR